MLSAPASDLIRRRFSCRHYDGSPIAAEMRAEIAAAVRSIGPGPFGSSARFELLAATEDDASALRRLGTYGKIKDPPAYLVGVLTPEEGRTLAGDIFNREFRRIGDDWTKRPITLTFEKSDV